MATLSDSERPAIGMVSRSSTAARPPAGRPWASLPSTTRHRTGEVGLRRRACRRRTTVATRRTPSVAQRAPAPSPRHLRWRRARGTAPPPMPARTSGCSGRPSSRRTVPPRRRRPRRPAGACRRCRDRRRRRAPARAVRRRPPRRRRRRVTSTRAATAASPCGVTVSTARASTSGVTSRTTAPASTASATTARVGVGRWRRPPRRDTPAASASASRVGAVDHERALLQTRSAAPREAPQPLHARMARTPTAAPAAEACGRAQALSLARASVAACDQRGERGRLPHGEVGEDLAVDLDLGEAQAGDEPAVAGAVLAAGGVDPLDPERPEVALAGPAVAERVPPGVHDGLVGGLVGPALVAVVALGPLEDGPALLLDVDGALDPCHVVCSFVVVVRPSGRASA